MDFLKDKENPERLNFLMKFQTFSPPLAQAGPNILIFSPPLAQVGPNILIFSPPLAQVGPDIQPLAQFTDILPTLGPCGPQYSDFWPKTSPFWTQLKPELAKLGATGTSPSNLRPWPNWANRWGPAFCKKRGPFGTPCKMLSGNVYKNTNFFFRRNIR